MIRSLYAILVACALTGCLEGKKISDVDAPPTPAPVGPQWRLPAGVATPPDARERPMEVDGIFAATNSIDQCCWLGIDASLVLAAPARATQADLAFLVPQYAFFERPGQTLTLRYGARTRRLTELVPGVRRATIDISGPRHRLAIHADRAFVPAREGVNSDTRALAIELLGITYR